MVFILPAEFRAPPSMSEKNLMKKSMMKKNWEKQWLS
jgi:hypothetical protein